MTLAAPPDLGARLADELPGITDDVLAAIAAEVPLYARPLEGEFGRNVQIGVEVALTRFIDVASHPDRDPTDPEATRGSRGLGRLEARAQRPLEALLAAYRVGARLAWRRWAQVLLADDVDPAFLVVLAERLFAYIDALSAAAAEGYATEHGSLAGERERQRTALARLLLRPGVGADEVRHQAAVAAWPVPSSLVTVLAPAEAPLRMRLGIDALVLVEEDRTIALVAAPVRPGSLAGIGAVVGPAGPVTSAADSLARALRAQELGLTGDPVLADDHRWELLLHADPPLLAELTESCLAPLAGETPASRERLEETLLAWLRLEGARAAVADSLAVHPQTVRYRLSRLRELFGERLDDPDERFHLELVLRARQGTQDAEPRPSLR